MRASSGETDVRTVGKLEGEALKMAETGTGRRVSEAFGD